MNIRTLMDSLLPNLSPSNFSVKWGGEGKGGLPDKCHCQSNGFYVVKGHLQEAELPVLALYILLKTRWPIIWIYLCSSIKTVWLMRAAEIPLRKLFNELHCCFAVTAETSCLNPGGFLQESWNDGGWLTLNCNGCAVSHVLPLAC